MDGREEKVNSSCWAFSVCSYLQTFKCSLLYLLSKGGIVLQNLITKQNNQMSNVYDQIHYPGN